MTPEEFELKMLEIYDNDPAREHGGSYDEEASHGDADDLMCKVLQELGYSAGVEVFEKASKWYA